MLELINKNHAAPAESSQANQRSFVPEDTLLLESLAVLGKPGTFGADELFPAFVYAVLQAYFPSLNQRPRTRAALLVLLMTFG